MKVLTEAQRRAIAEGGVLSERRAKKWVKDQGFKITRFYTHKHAGCFDIEARKNCQSWMIEVKSGVSPKVIVENLIKMTNTPNIQKIGLLFIPKSDDPPLLFSLNRMSYAGLKASKTKGKEVERKAGKKASRAIRSQK